ncbi:MAG: glycosyltransferase family 2 protein [Pseudomonadota bacterium]|nr:glycosyltransferase family 2 protein [Pseudomonadota bacterium]
MTRLLIVIPTLNEAAHIADVLASVCGFPAAGQAMIVVADGGSTDATRDIVRRAAVQDARIRLIDNPGRLQSAAVNLAVAQFGDQAEWLLRMDAHSHYPQDFADALLAEAAATGADSVVVSMDARGDGFWQKAIAAAQNSRLGNGGSAHRLAGRGAWVDHGHHALMRISAFRAVGGYDEAFSHNEDAELDHRLRQAGFRIWLTGRTRLVYVPRSSLAPLMRQYQAFGRGRRRNLSKHGARPGMRQAVVALLAPALALAVLAPFAWIFTLPLLGWVAICLAGGIAIALAERSLTGLPAGFFAGAMHLAWSVGFWREWLAGRRPSEGRLRHG